MEIGGDYTYKISIQRSEKAGGWAYFLLLTTNARSIETALGSNVWYGEKVCRDNPSLGYGFLFYARSVALGSSELHFYQRRESIFIAVEHSRHDLESDR